MFEHTFAENMISQETIMDPCELPFYASLFQVMGQVIFFIFLELSHTYGHEVFPS